MYGGVREQMYDRVDWAKDVFNSSLQLQISHYISTL